MSTAETLPALPAPEPVDPDLALRERLNQFAIDLGTFVAELDAKAVGAQLDQLDLLLAGKPAPKKTTKPALDEEALATLLGGLQDDLTAILKGRAAGALKDRLAQVRQQLEHPAPTAFFKPPKLASRPRDPNAAPGLRAISPPKPCPICKVENTARRYSYLCEAHRTPENLNRYKGQ